VDDVSGASWRRVGVPRVGSVLGGSDGEQERTQPCREVGDLLAPTPRGPLADGLPEGALTLPGRGHEHGQDGQDCPGEVDVGAEAAESPNHAGGLGVRQGVHGQAAVSFLLREPGFGPRFARG